MTTKALAPDVSTWPAENPQLIGSRCDDCSATMWPTQPRCPRCSGANISELLLPRRGTLVAWTTQGFVPKQPYAGNETAATFTPFAFGLVQLDDVVRVEARLVESDPEKLRPGMEVELTFVPFYTDEEGTDIVTWAFAPI
ncbi:Zn-ribbon domain-containing OB-fold protein [Rhodococcus rhodochrous]|uniref:Zn-ribbon domain-containing OB-fold protein n=1 Tax=Rhodococcus rhodochrous TaxID=1829 RepID=UPI000D070E17|nr:Zn-ribbon domain-containing OB-fold protein [Rhodococcus rhodochrous]AYA26930.1 Zn-ribbon domain-containing OB-fold protein [Rhodococcus rhodochrous]